MPHAAQDNCVQWTLKLLIIYRYIQLMFTCGITPINDFIFPLDRCIEAWPVLPQLWHFDQSLLVCLVGLQASIPRSLPGNWVKAHNTLSVWKTPISIDWLWHGYDQQFGFCYLFRPTANIRENRRDDSCEVGTYLNQCCNFQSNCVHARNTYVFEAPIWNVFWWIVGRSDSCRPVPVSC